MSVMDRFILNELIKRGFSIAESAATAAGYNLLSGDSLAIDNLTAKLKDHQSDIAYVTAVDNDGKILAHSELGMAGKTFSYGAGEVLETRQDGGVAKEILRDGKVTYEFGIPITFAEKKLGNIFVGIGNDALEQAQAVARKNMILVSLMVLLLGLFGIFFLSAFITTPIKNLSQGVSELSAGRYSEGIRIVSKDELGELTKNFNKMAKLITDQKSRLVKHATELEEAYMSIVKVLATAIDARDPRTLGHSARVASLSRLLGERMGLSYGELKDLEMACLFHDVGKIRTPDEILLKDGPLNDDENLLMMKHTEDGAEILKLVNSLHKHIPVILYHHEWFNGEGYPTGLSGSDIPLFASILSITDAYDAMTSSRPYREALTKEEAIDQLEAFRGKQFDPRLTDLFVEVIRSSEIRPERSFIES
jgi:putative nucleotidyltransferase with HDIG domain